MLRDIFFPFRKPADENFTYGDITSRLFAFGIDMVIMFFFIFHITELAMAIAYPEGDIIEKLRLQTAREHPELIPNSLAMTQYIAAKYPDEFRRSISQFAFGIVVQVVVMGIYNIYFTYKKGATIGKLALGLKVVDNITHEKLTLSQCFIRYIGYIPSCLVLGLGVFWGGLHPRRRCWHDLLADTIVVYTERKWLTRFTDPVKKFFKLK